MISSSSWCRRESSLPVDARRRSTSRWRVELSSTTPYPRSRTSVRASAYCRRSAASSVRPAESRYSSMVAASAHAMNASPSGGAIGTRSPTWTREPNGCGGPVTASITMSSPTPRTGETSESEILRETFHLRQRVVDDAIAALRCRTERDERGTERVRTGARMPTDQTALLERARDRMRAGVAQVGLTSDLRERPR